MGFGEASPQTPPPKQARQGDCPDGAAVASRPPWDGLNTRVSATRVRDTPIAPIPLDLGIPKIKTVTIAGLTAPSPGPSATPAPVTATAQGQPAPKKGPLEAALGHAIRDAKTQATQREDVLREIAGAIDPLAQKLRGYKLRFFQSLQTNILAVCQAALVGGGGQGALPHPALLPVTEPDAAEVRARTVSRGRSRGRAPSRQPSQLATATSAQLPTAPSTYAAVAASQPAPQPGAKPATRAARTPTTAKDQRLLVRISRDSPAREHHPWAITVALRGKFGDQVKEVRRIPTGFAVVPRNKASRETLLNQREALGAMLGGTIEVPGEQYSYFVPRVPTAVHDLHLRRVQVTTEAVAQEAEATTGVAPVRVTPTRDTNLPTRNYIIVFPKKVNTFHLYGSSGPARAMRDRPRVLQCTNCWDYHDTRACRGLAKCRMCGSETCDRPGSCGNHIQCAVCHGPHPADDGKCPLRPSIKHGAIARPTRNQRTAVRRANDRAREATHQDATTAPGSSLMPAVQASPGLPSSATDPVVTGATDVVSNHSRDAESSPL